MSLYTPVVKDGETRRVLQLRSPIDLEPIGELVCASREDVQAALVRARARRNPAGPRRVLPSAART